MLLFDEVFSSFRNEFSLKENNFMESQDIRKPTVGEDSAPASGVQNENEEDVEELDTSTTVGEDCHNQTIEDATNLVNSDPEEAEDHDGSQNEDTALTLNRRRSGGSHRVAKKQLQTSGRSLNR